MTSHHSNIGFQNLRICAMGRGPSIQPAHTLTATMMADFDFTMEIEFSFPYINAVTKKAQLFETPPHIRFAFDHILCVLHPGRGLASPFDDSTDARGFILRLMAF